MPTGITLQIPEGYEGQIRPRSGMALHYGVTVLNTPGTIDADYRGEIKVLLINLSGQAYGIVRGAHIAQLVIAPVCRATWVDWADQELDVSKRGASAFGSTGM